jgi:7,8-dihydropterin-6-yl-methyl-4-(beta-D-ribofuranosyl)aminobenzene 5'-phosphate synthase
MKKSSRVRALEEVTSVAVTVITDNYYDALRPDEAIGTRYRTSPGSSIHAEHGLSYFIETMTTTGRPGALMFDYGVDPAGVLRNIKLLGIDLRRVDALGLSHGHFDHWGGLIGILKRNRTKIRRGTPLYLGAEAFAHRYSLRPSDNVPQDLGRLDRRKIENLDVVRIAEVTKPAEVIPGAYFTGTIERVTDYEHVRRTLLIQRNDLREQDQMVGEQAVVFALKGKGLVVLSGCAHVGIVNTIKHAQKMTGITRVHAIVGGFHLVNPDPQVLDATVADVKAFAPAYIIPTHCTGFEAITRFQKEMPEQFILNTAGTRYVFGA